MGVNGWIVLIVAGVLGVSLIGYIVSLYNNLVEVRNNIEKAWKNIDVLLQQRHDELVKLVDAVSGYVKHEREVLEAITKLRVAYRSSKTTEEKIGIENKINERLAQVRHVWEAYPTLKASENFLQLQQRISALESSIADRREFFNDSVNVYNIQIESLPQSVLAARMGYKRHAMLEVPEAAKQDVKIAIV